jgi:feruloyl esterase
VSQNYAIKWQVRLPTNWNGRFYMPGGGGLNGNIPDTTSHLADGYAEAASDSGHDANTNTDPNAGGAPPPGLPLATGTFGTDFQARVDFAYNAITQTTQIAKSFIALYYSRAPQFSYFEGCSMGGREAMMVTQRLPSQFDGVVSGDPGFKLISMSSHEVYDAQLLGGLASRMGLRSASGNPLITNTFTNQDLQIVSKSILDACDALDGLADGMVNRPLQCTTDKVLPQLQAKQCSGAKDATCLTADQINTLVSIYAGPVTPKGQRPYFPWMWDAGIAGCTSAADCNTPTSTNIATGWRSWKLGTFQPNLASSFNDALDFSPLAGAGLSTLIAPTPPVVPAPGANEGQLTIMLNYNLDSYLASLSATTSAFPVSSVDLLNADSTNLSEFRDRGGKLIIYQPQSGGPFSPMAMVDWYQKVNASNGNAFSFAGTQQFARLFMVPGMQHCGGGPGTTRFDAFTSVVKWVENKAPPASILATAPTDTPWPGRTRPLCPFPTSSVYKGSGSIDDAANFACQ